MDARRFFHSFARPKANEEPQQTLDRSLAILSFIKDAGFILAPEVVTWDVNSRSSDTERLEILQRRACFTELSAEELPSHSKIFGPLALSFRIEKLRTAGATPVIYVPQGLGDSALSRIGATCAYGVYHTQYVLRQLQGLKEASDPQLVSKRFDMPVAVDYNLTLKNTDSAGTVVAEYNVPAAQVQQMLQHVGFNNIPFDHSMGILGVFLNMFYPTDNSYTDDHLGYYRQREWRVIAGDLNFNGRPLGRPLSEVEIERLRAIDPLFWNRELTVGGVTSPRSTLAVLYDPLPDWNFLELIEAVFAPSEALERVRNIVGTNIPVHPLA